MSPCTCVAIHRFCRCGIDCHLLGHALRVLRVRVYADASALDKFAPGVNCPLFIVLASSNFLFLLFLCHSSCGFSISTFRTGSVLYRLHYRACVLPARRHAHALESLPFVSYHLLHLFLGFSVEDLPSSFSEPWCCLFSVFWDSSAVSNCLSILVRSLAG